MSSELEKELCRAATALMLKLAKPEAGLDEAAGLWWQAYAALQAHRPEPEPKRRPRGPTFAKTDG